MFDSNVCTAAVMQHTVFNRQSVNTATICNKALVLYRLYLLHKGLYLVLMPTIT